MSEFLDFNDPAVRYLAQQIATLRREMRTQARAAQGPLRSVDVGEGGTTYFSEDGTPLMQVGVGEDGEFGIINVDPSPPPVPTAPVLEPAISGVKIIWDGTFVDANWTTNTSHVEVHVSNEPEFVADDTTQVTTFVSQNGGEFTFATPNDTDLKYVALVAVSSSGVESDKSEEASAAGLVVNAEVAAAINELIAQVNNNTEEISNNAANFENLDVTTQVLLDTTASLDGRVSTSDYAPGPEDVAGRNDGSVWFARTRPRTNICTNPSVEVDTTDYIGNLATIDRVAASGPVDGEYVGQVTNSADIWYHYVFWAPGGVGWPVTPGEVWSASVYADLISGVGVGYGLQLYWYDATYTLIPGTGVSYGPGEDLVVGTWKRLTVTAAAPATAAYMMVGLVAPFTDPNAVWRFDAMMVEESPLIGSYFDGTSYDCTWADPLRPNRSASVMAGNKVIRFLELDDNAWGDKKFSGAVLADIDAGTITTGYMDGERIQDNSIPNDKLMGVPCTAGEALAAGDLVNIYSVGGVAFARKADADNDRPAHGFVYNAVVNGGLATIHTAGYITGLAGMTIGAQYLSTTAGKTASVPAGTVNTISQRIGFAVSPTVLLYDPSVPVYIK